MSSTHASVDPSAPRGFPSAAVTVVSSQKVTLLALVALLVVAAVIDAPKEFLVLNALMTAFYLASTVYRVYLIDLSLRRHHEIVIAPDALLTPPDGEWPKYMVMVPLYKEADILPNLVAGLKRLDYPEDRLEIRLLVEADDEETMSAAEAMDLEPPFVVFPIPVSQPRTKPKACNVALQNCDAKYTVIYDAEDRPDPDQLKKAVIAFSTAPADVVCIQAKLNFYNPNQNILTRWFTAEYATWFDLCLPALDALQAPIPLGGTSNHFRMDLLRQLGGWDEYNVTEDCDLGLRLFVSGWKTRILDSTTWEQACPSIRYWIPQRSRWVKGYIQTYLVHMRSPLALTRKLGLINSIHFHLLIGGTPLCQLVNPFYWFLAVLWFTRNPQGLDVFFPGPVFVMAAICLFAGNFTFAYTCGIACVRRGFGHLAIYGLAMPLYWAMMSVAAWKGFLQLFFKPHHWEKTKHFGVEAEELQS